MSGRIAVLGAGGMGSAFAALLARSGQDVVLVGRGSAHVRAVADAGLVVHPPDEPSWTSRPDVAVHARDLPAGSVDVLVLLTKVFDLAEATASAMHALAPDGVAVSLQNGLGIDPVLGRTFGPSRALVGTTTVGAALQDPGHISVSVSTATGNSITYVGELGLARGGARGDDVAQSLTKAGTPTEHATAVGERIWEKLALAVMSPLSSVLGLTVGQVWATQQGRTLVRQMFEETVAVAAAQGVALDREAAWAHASRVFEGTGEHYTSMCTDVRNGRRTELATMAGEVHRLALADGVPVPVHTIVLDLLGALGVRS